MYKQKYCIICRVQLDQKNVFLCKRCQEQQIQSKDSVQQRSNMHEFDCPKCTFKNHYDAIQCTMCNLVFEQSQSIEKVLFHIKREISIVACKSCKFQNELSNEYCLNCQEELFQHIKKKCQICGFSVREENYPKHYQECILSKSLIEEEQQMIKLKALQVQIKPSIIKPVKIVQKLPIGEVKLLKPINNRYEIWPAFNKMINKQEQIQTSCSYCYQKLQKRQLTNHLNSCLKKYLSQKEVKPSYLRMTPLQVKAIMYMHDKSYHEHQSLRKSLLDRVNKLGFKNQDLNNLQFYIENYAPIIIQIHVSRHMQFFIQDTHYRNQFETNKSSGSLSRSSRNAWENRMFDHKYSKATDFQRVKYGVINFTNDPKGVQCAKLYGPSYFLLKSHVRDRCTFTDKDSGSADASIATLKFGFKIVSKMNDNELKAAFNASKALQESSSVLITYKQLQIHGPIEFDKDIERIYVSKQEIKDKKHLLDMVYAFSQKFKVNHDFI